MTKIKLCGLSRVCDIQAANRLRPEYIGFVFAAKSKRCVTPQKAADLKAMLDPAIQAVGMFVDEAPETVAGLLNSGTIDICQLHGREDEAYIRRLRQLTDRPIIRAFRIGSEQDIPAVQSSTADYVLLDSGAGTGKVFDWDLAQKVHRPYFLAGGLGIDNVEKAVQRLAPFAVDVSSGIETDGTKDEIKMAEFVAAVRKERKI